MGFSRLRRFNSAELLDFFIEPSAMADPKYFMLIRYLPNIATYQGEQGIWQRWLSAASWFW